MANPNDPSGSTYISCSEEGAGTLQECPWDTYFYEEMGFCDFDCWRDQNTDVTCMQLGLAPGSDLNGEGPFFSEPQEDPEDDCHKYIQCVLDVKYDYKWIQCKKSCPPYRADNGQCYQMEFSYTSHECREPGVYGHECYLQAPVRPARPYHHL